jgi:hypothetical protein
MNSMVAFAAGLATGWLARSALDSTRGAAVSLLASVIDTIERLRRLTTIERERLEDLMAEARAQVDTRKAARTARSRHSEARVNDAA